MVRRRKIWAIASFEFLSEVRKVGFIVAVLGVPLALLAYGALVAVIGVLSEGGASKKPSYGVVDQSGVMRLDSAIEATVSLVPFPDEASAMAALKARQIDGWYLLQADYLVTGQATAYAAESGGLSGREPERVLRETLRARLLRDAVPADLSKRIQEPLMVSKTWTVKLDGEVVERGIAAAIARFALPFVFAILLFIAIIGTGMTLVQGTATEKENRVVDVLLSSATADEIMAGKLLGQGGVGLLQVAAWFGMAGFSGLIFARQLGSLGITIPVGPLIVALIYFVAGYFFLGSLLLGTGALGSNFKEGQRWSILWILMAALPMAFLAAFIREPQSPLAKLFSWFPFSSSWVVTFRFWMDPAGTPWWEIIGPFLLLVVCTWVTVRAGARLLRLGLLLTGSHITPAEVIRQLRLKP